MALEVRNMNGLLGTFPPLLYQTRLSVYFQGVKERINVEEQRNHQLAKPTRRDTLCMHTILPACLPSEYY